MSDERRYRVVNQRRRERDGYWYRRVLCVGNMWVREGADMSSATLLLTRAEATLRALQEQEKDDSPWPGMGYVTVVEEVA